MRLTEVYSEASMMLDLKAQEKPAILRELAQRMAEQQGSQVDAIATALIEREALASTAIGDGIAMPHGRTESVRQVVGAIGRRAQGVDFDSVDGKPTQLFFAIIAPSGPRNDVLAALGRLSRVLRSHPDLKDRLLQAHSPAEAYAALSAADTEGV
jgi:PTS system nitrogen regulatory IIA component